MGRARSLSVFRRRACEQLKEQAAQQGLVFHALNDVEIYEAPKAVLEIELGGNHDCAA